MIRILLIILSLYILLGIVSAMIFDWIHTYYKCAPEAFICYPLGFSFISLFEIFFLIVYGLPLAFGFVILILCKELLVTFGKIEYCFWICDSDSM